ncbi:MAG: GTP cyclohydrolase II [Polymorphobacter sp.]
MSASAQQVARAVDELRRGQPVCITGDGGALTVRAVALADAASLAALDADGRADLLLARPRAALLNIVNQRAAEGAGVVRIARAPWMDLAASVAIADPVRDLESPFKGPFRAAELGNLGAAAAAAIRLVKAGGLLPAVFARGGMTGAALTVDAQAVLGYARADSLRLVARARLPLDGAPDTEVVAFRPTEGGPEHLALIIGAVFGSDRAFDEPAPPVLTRLHSACLTGDVLGSLKCDCGPQLRSAIAAIAGAGGGVLLYLQQEGRGIGLINKLRAYALQDQGFDTVDANLRLGFESDERDFELAARMLALLGIDRIRLLTNNPDKVAALEQRGIRVVDRVAHQMAPNPHNAAYLATKRDRSGHLL